MDEMFEKRQPTPSGLKTGGRRLWVEVTEEFTLHQHELQLLQEACRMADRLDAIHKAMVGQPLVVKGARGDDVTHPLLVESRMLGQAFARVLASVRLPDEEDGEDKRPQRRGGVRGPYGNRRVG